MCTSSAIYLCKCSSPNIPYCLQHYEEHVKYPGIHWTQHLKAGLDLHFFGSLIHSLHLIRNRIITNSAAKYQKLQEESKGKLQKLHTLSVSERIVENMKITAELNEEFKNIQYCAQTVTSRITRLIEKVIAKRETNALITDFVEKECLPLKRLLLSDNKILGLLNSLQGLSQQKHLMLTIFAKGTLIAQDEVTIIGQMSNKNSIGVSENKNLSMHPYSKVTSVYSNQDEYKPLRESPSEVELNTHTYASVRFVNMTSPDGATYEGEISNRRPHGKGTLQVSRWFQLRRRI